MSTVPNNFRSEKKLTFEIIIFLMEKKKKVNSTESFVSIHILKATRYFQAF